MTAELYDENIHIIRMLLSEVYILRILLDHSSEDALNKDISSC